MFSETSKSIIFFCYQLIEELRINGQSKVFFLAREGQFLKQIFEAVVKKEGLDIESHYMCVSRVSTCLPSLRPLEEESFDTLFRQYRTISVFEFLSSLGLSELLPELAKELSISDHDLRERSDDLPTSSIFERVLSSGVFKNGYESKRITQRKLIQRYFFKHLDDLEDVCIVDVGWKGTIQDHLYSALEIEKTSRVLRGFYMGLLYPTNVSRKNVKSGLVFSRNRVSRSDYFWVFNENRALFELLLSADHGSTLSYKASESDGDVQVDFQPFLEEEQYHSIVGPIQAHLAQSIDNLLAQEDTMSFVLKDVAKAHKRMVFMPTEIEIETFQNLFQYENFGFFENTEFVLTGSKLVGYLGIVRAIIKGDESKFGFWPYVYIKSKYGLVLAKIYKMRSRFLL